MRNTRFSLPGLSGKQWFSHAVLKDNHKLQQFFEWPSGNVETGLEDTDKVHEAPLQKPTSNKSDHSSFQPRHRQNIQEIPRILARSCLTTLENIENR